MSQLTRVTFQGQSILSDSELLSLASVKSLQVIVLDNCPPVDSASMQYIAFLACRVYRDSPWVSVVINDRYASEDLSEFLGNAMPGDV